AVRGQEDRSDKGEADPDHAPASVGGRGPYLGLLPYRYERRGIWPCSKCEGDDSVVERLHLNVGRPFRPGTSGNTADTALANEPMVDEETKAPLGETCFARDRPDEAAAERGDDEDTPDRPSTVDDTQTIFGVPSMQSACCTGKKDDPRIGVLDH